ncbi:IS3 family transposase, partial [Devosia sp.]|uniref:IS3 family transposase n=1 Tax=Devosia sp. TaxID=1871048 RepID=UPI0025BD1C0A
LQSLDHMTISVIRHRRRYRNFHQQILRLQTARRISDQSQNRYAVAPWRLRFAYLAVVIDLFSRRVIGWSLQSRQVTDVVLQALLMAVWRRKPKTTVLVHSDQGSQFTSMDWAAFLKHHNLEHSMSRRGNCHDNAVAESFFNVLKRERIRRKTYRTREEARQDVFDYIEMFYNPKRKHVRNGMLSPVEFERQHNT